MSREEQIVQERMRKLSELRANGINPYPNKYNKNRKRRNQKPYNLIEIS